MAETAPVADSSDLPRRSRLAFLLTTLLVASLAVALLRYGATELWTRYAIFLTVGTITLFAIVFLRPLPRLRPTSVAILAVGVALLLQTWLQPTLLGRGYVLAALGWLVFFLASWLTEVDDRVSRWLIVSLILIGAFEALFGLVQSLGGIDYIGSYFRDRGRIATGTLIARAHYAGLLNMLLPLYLSYVVVGAGGRSGRGEARARLWFFVLAGSFVGLAVVLSLSRGGVISLVLTLLFMAGLSRIRRRRIKSSGLAGAAPVVLLLVVLALGTAVGLDALLERFDPDEVGGRPTIYKTTVEMIADHPVTGIGPGMFEWRFPAYRPAELIKKRFVHVHNDYLEIAVEWGLPVAILFWLFVAWRCYASGRVFLQSRNPWRATVALAASTGIFSILVHSLVDFNLHIASNLMVFAILLALAGWAVAGEQRSRERRAG